MAKRKNPAAVALGRLGGLKSGAKGARARFAKMTPEQRSALARKAVMMRWARWRERKGQTKTSGRLKNGRKRKRNRGTPLRASTSRDCCTG